MTYQNLIIEDNVPMPNVATGAPKTSIWWKIKPGQSVFVPGKTTSAMHSTLAPSKKAGFKYAARAVKGGVRVWCIEAPEGNGND